MPVDIVITVAGAPTGEHAQSDEQMHTTFCVIVKAIVSVEVTGLDENVGEGVGGVVGVEDCKIGELDLVVALLADVGTRDEVDAVGMAVVGREDVEPVLDLLVEIVLVLVAEDDTEPGTLPTTEPTHAFQFVMPLRQVVEIGWPVC